MSDFSVRVGRFAIEQPSNLALGLDLSFEGDLVSSGGPGWSGSVGDPGCVSARDRQKVDAKGTLWSVYWARGRRSGSDGRASLDRSACTGRLDGFSRGSRAACQNRCRCASSTARQTHPNRNNRSCGYENDCESLSTTSRLTLQEPLPRSDFIHLDSNSTTGQDGRSRKQVHRAQESMQRDRRRHP